jgi:hypothetical protein
MQVYSFNSTAELEELNLKLPNDISCALQKLVGDSRLPTVKSYGIVLQVSCTSIHGVCGWVYVCGGVYVGVCVCVYACMCVCISVCGGVRMTLQNKVQAANVGILPIVKPCDPISTAMLPPHTKLTVVAHTLTHVCPCLALLTFVCFWRACTKMQHMRKCVGWPTQ